MAFIINSRTPEQIEHDSKLAAFAGNIIADMQANGFAPNDWEQIQTCVDLAMHRKTELVWMQEDLS